ncbi:MAG: glycosyltransferase family 2 protein [Mesorhizobium sp.]
MGAVNVPGAPPAPRPVEVAVLVPCYNEAQTISQVVADFRAALPDATIYVYDNNSKDGTAEIARNAGAVVRTEHRQGKGNVVRRMFSDIDADVYLLVDGDDTYEAAAAPRMVGEILDKQLDKVNGIRVHSDQKAYRPGHVTGNRLLSGLVTELFGVKSRDMLSGYKALSRRFVKSFPSTSSGFEIETELLIHAIELDLPMTEIETAYKERPEGSVSKLSTFRDGFRILGMIVQLVRDLMPLKFFSIIAAVLALFSIGFVTPVIYEFFLTGLVPRFPTLIVSSVVMSIAVLSLFAGLILDSVARGRRETKLLAYLRYPMVSK